MRRVSRCARSWRAIRSPSGFPAARLRPSRRSPARAARHRGKPQYRSVPPPARIRAPPSQASPVPAPPVRANGNPAPTGAAFPVRPAGNGAAARSIARYTGAGMRGLPARWRARPQAQDNPPGHRPPHNGRAPPGRRERFRRCGTAAPHAWPPGALPAASHRRHAARRSADRPASPHPLRAAYRPSCDRRDRSSR